MNGTCRRHGRVSTAMEYFNSDPRAAAVPASWREPVGQWRTAMRASGASDETLRTRTYWVVALARWVGMSPWEVSGDDLVLWGGAHEWASETRRSVYSAIRKFYGWAHGRGLIQTDPSLDLPHVKEAPPSPHPCPDEVVRQAIAAADDDVALMITLAVRLGLRRGEVARIHARDVIEDLDGLSLVVHGKGGKERVVPLDVCLAHDVTKRADGGYLFPGRHGHIAPGTVGDKVAAALPGDWTMHSLRHRFGTVAYARSHDLMAVQKVLGHASPRTTQRYVAIDHDRLRAVVEAAR